MRMKKLLRSRKLIHYLMDAILRWPHKAGHSPWLQRLRRLIVPLKSAVIGGLTLVR